MLDEASRQELVRRLRACANNSPSPEAADTMHDAADEILHLHAFVKLRMEVSEFTDR